MQSILITGKNREELIKEARKIAKNEDVLDVDFSVFEDENIFGIDTLRKAKERIFLKPIKSRNKAIVFDFLNGATIETQNAMLKILEEPPNSTLVILLGKKADYFLPTIISRCRVIEIKSIHKADDGRELEDLLKSDLTKKFVTAQNLSKDKDKALDFILESIFYLRAKMKHEAIGEDAKTKARMIRELEKAHYSLSETNINPRMTLENLFLSL